MVDEITQTDIGGEGNIERKSQIPVRSKSPKPKDQFFDNSMPKKTHLNHVPKQSALRDQKDRPLSPERTPKSFSYTIPFSSRKTPTLLDTPRKTPKPHQFRDQSLSPSKSSVSRTSPELKLSSVSQTPLQPPTRAGNAKNGIYFIVESFLNGPILGCLDLDSLKAPMNVSRIADDAQSVLTDIILENIS
jgi:hypothetical protein